ncbi:hypothetical protein GC176_26845 [bacterium]|nr:hypothetical protein [bacterium]
MSRELFKEILSDVGAELGRLGVQGQMEMASALFNGDAFVPYGPGQITPEAAPDLAAEQIEMPQQEMGGMEM